MNLPKIDLSSLPGLEAAQGLFGSITQSNSSYGDEIVILMVYIHDTLPPETII